MKYFILLFFFTTASCIAFAGTVSGEITSAKDSKPLPFASILVKGTTVGVSANAAGKYSISLDPGEYTLVCQFVGYAAEEKKVKVSRQSIEVNFSLAAQEYKLSEVVVKSGAEDPAYEIIRQTIAVRASHLNEAKAFTCDVYLKGQLQLRNYPDKFFGQKVDFEDGDSSKRKMIFLSETFAKYAQDENGNQKTEVVSTKVSGRSDGFGLGSPRIVSFYENNVNFTRNLNPRGFISPIANNALAYYRYKFEGSFYENGREINRIRVIPKRKLEPLFSGTINITEGDWYIHSVDLTIYKDQQMQLLDTFNIKQLYVPDAGRWVIKNQIAYPSGKFFGFDFFGNFVQVYDAFNFSPNFKKKYFDNTIIKFRDSANKKTLAYWDSIRPVPLQPEEIRDYVKKDSLEQLRKDPRYLDSLDKKRNKLNIVGLLLTSQSFSRQKNKISIEVPSVLNSLNYNTVEGGSLRFVPTFEKTYEGRKSLTITPELRYGLANQRFNPSIATNYTFGKKYYQNLDVSFGRKVFQFNNANPIRERTNTLYTLMGELNYMKIYEASFFRAAYNRGIGNGLNVGMVFQFQDRKPLENLVDPLTWRDRDNRVFTPNYPVEAVPSAPLQPNKASLLTVGITWQPGAKYIELPDRKINTGSTFPTMNLSVTKGVNSLFGSNADFTRWRFYVTDDLNLKLFGKLSYRFNAGGFTNRNNVSVVDYQHVLGNQTIFAADYLNSFQLAPYYRFSNTSDLMTSFHAEYHLNGFLTNKIPGFKKLNWFLVTGVNTLNVNKGERFTEYFIGLENIFKVLRVDFVQGFEQNGARPTGFRLSLPFIR